MYKVTLSPGASATPEADAATHLFRYWIHHRDISNRSVVARQGGIIIPCTSVWNSSRLSMRRRSLAMAEKWRPPGEKRCNEKKAKVPRSRSASTVDGMASRRTFTAIRKESADARHPSNCCTRREASVPPRVDASTDPWRSSQVVNPPPVHAGSREGFNRLKFLQT